MVYQLVPRSKHSDSVIKTSQLMVFQLVPRGKHSPTRL